MVHTRSRCAAAFGGLLVGALLTGSSGEALGQSVPTLSSSASAKWNEIVDDWRARLRDQGIVGGSIGMVRDGSLVALETEGMADLATHRPVDQETIYHWASITKTFTSIAIMQLRDEGRLSLDDPIVEYVPELRAVHNPYGSMEDITIRQLMSHSAGFRDPTWPWDGGEPWQPFEPTEWSQLVAMMPYTRILFPPGSKYSYSNPGLIFLGRVIEAVSGDVFEAYIDKNIFRPLGMRRAYFDMTPRTLRANRSNHYYVRGGKPEPGGIDFNTGITVANGGLNAPIPDMARYLSFLLGTPYHGSADEGVDGHGLTREDYDGVLARSSLEEMWQPVVPIGDNPMGDASMGLSFFLYDRAERRVVGHTGTQAAFYSFFYLDPPTGSAVIEVTNTGPGDETAPDADAVRVHTSARLVNELFPLLREHE